MFLFKRLFIEKIVENSLRKHYEGNLTSEKFTHFAYGVIGFTFFYFINIV